MSILREPLSAISGIGEELEKKFKLVGIKTIDDLIRYYPRKYEDYSHITPIKKIRPGTVTIQAKFKQVKGRYLRRGLHITEAIASDATDSVRIIWFNQPYRESSLKAGAEYYISGQFGLNKQKLSILNPSIELVQDFPVNTARIVPTYSETKGLNSTMIRRAVRSLLPYIRTLDENLPDWLVKELHLPSHSTAIEAMHFPEAAEDITIAHKRLGFEEVFSLSLASLLNKEETSKEKSLVVPFNEKLARQFVKSLPFRLTDAQRATTWKIYKNMQEKSPMNRLVEGDVGSGKTVVSAMAALMVMHSNLQIAFMAPTELLARQHADTFYTLLSPLDLSDRIGLLTGSMTAHQKQLAKQRVKNGDIQLIIGTHALLEEDVDMKSLGLIVIDEQHRFGVEQRKKLIKKAGHMPHVLFLTATPIPRSLALTLYGELDVSILDEVPSTRKPVQTSIVSPNSRKQLNERIRNEVNQGHQIFIVCPAITESSVLDVRSVEKVYDEAKREFSDYNVGLLHGKLKANDKNSVMEAFVRGKIDILVATTVIEVGVDVPNATIMVIESSERFGLAQLHQLRGRVGRDQAQGYCYLVMSDSRAPTSRMRAMVSSNDGFKLAALDLRLRGPGAIYGTFQHGQLDLRVAKLSDTRMITEARRAAKAFIDKKENIRQYKELFSTVERLRAVTNLN